MSSRTKLIVIILVILLLVLTVVGIAYMTTRRALTGPGGSPPLPTEEDTTSSPKMGRYDLGEFMATSRDQEIHYIKVEVELGYVGSLENELNEREAELRDAITTILMKLNIQRAKEDYIDGFLHKDIEKKLNNILGKSTSESRIIKVFIPVFLIN